MWQWFILLFCISVSYAIGIVVAFLMECLHNIEYSWVRTQIIIIFWFIAGPIVLVVWVIKKIRGIV